MGMRGSMEGLDPVPSFYVERYVARGKDVIFIISLLGTCPD